MGRLSRAGKTAVAMTLAAAVWCASAAAAGPGPAPAITVGPVSVSGQIASVSFRADDPATRFTCRLDRRATERCGAPAAYGRLAAGRHTVTVAAEDRAGRVTTVRRVFRVSPPGR